jgi:hypothetical protein
MPRFTKQADCTTSAALAALAAGTLSPLARLAAEPHLRACDFCAAELRLHLHAAPAAPAATTPEPPPMPLALRLFAESKLAESAVPARRAA